MSDIPTLRKRALKAYDLISNLNALFNNNDKENTIAIIMLAIEDGYRQGIEDAKRNTIIMKDG